MLRTKPFTLSALIGVYAGMALPIFALVLAGLMRLGLALILDDSLYNAANALARQIATVSLDAVLMHDYGVLERYTADLAGTDGLTYLRIRRTDGTVLAEAGDSASVEPVLRLERPVLLAGRPVGDVTVAYARRDIDQAINRFTLISIAGLAVLAVALFLTLKSILRRRLIAPIERLALEMNPLRDSVPEADSAATAPSEVIELRQTFVQLRNEVRRHIAEDDRDMARLLAEIATEAGFAPRISYDGRAAVQALQEDTPDVLLTDLRLPEPDGMALLRLARELDSAIQVVMITGYASVSDAVAGFKLGLHDLITKPFNNDQLQALLLRLKAYLEHRRRTEQLHARVTQMDTAPRDPVMNSRAARRCLDMVQQVAPLDVPVLIHGESGTGKGVLARHIHELSARREGPFFVLNCASVAESLVENELFGHEKGAFTGATERKRGLLELADGGTLLLDEINSTSMEVQAKLLQFMQERSLIRVGGERAVAIDVRLLVASNENLANLVDQGRFRRDLYYRLNVFPIDLPPLRERRDDILDLAERFLADYARRYGSPARTFSSDALDALADYHWPGNIRELENIVQRAVILARGEQVGVGQLPAELHTGAGRLAQHAWPVPADASLAELEIYWIRHMVERCDVNKSEAARRLGIDVSTVHRRLRGS